MDNPGYQPENNKDEVFSISRPTSKHYHLVRINSRFKPHRKSIYYKRAIIILTIFTTLLLISLMIFINLYFNRPQSFKFCLSKECVRSAASLQFSLNFSVNPCDNFYQFTCGKWSKEHLNHGWYETFSPFTLIMERILFKSFQVLNENVKLEEPEAVGQAKLLYQSCMSKESINALGLNPIYEQLDSTKLPKIPRIFNSTLDYDEFEWIQSEIMLKTSLDMDVIIGFVVAQNYFNRSENVIYLEKPSQKSSLSSFWRSQRFLQVVDNAELLKINSKLFKYISLAYLQENNIQVSEEILENAAEIITNFTNHFDSCNSSNINSTIDVYRLTKKISINELQEITKNGIETILPNFWINFLSNIFSTVNITIDSQRDFLYVTENDLNNIMKILNYILQQPSENLELYMWWLVTSAMIERTSININNFLTTIEEEYGLYTNSEDYSRPVRIECSEIVNSYMGWAVSYAIFDKNSSEKTISNIEKMVNNIKKSFVEQIEQLEWMDQETKQSTIEKSKEMLSFVGYPKWLFAEGGLDAQYMKLEINATTFLKNLVNIIKLKKSKVLQSLRQEQRRFPQVEPIIVNAYNQFSDNSINIPLAVLSYPLYNLGLEALNYGAIGSVLGHELIHGFDNVGNKIDKYGNYNQWWTNKTLQSFEELTKCFINQYNNFTVEGIEEHIDGEITLGENLADCGGLNQAYTAYKRFYRNLGPEPKLPGFEHYSNDQMFFIAYGSTWCEDSKPNYLKFQIANDEHSPSPVRAIGSLQNSKEFSKVFNCAKSTFMNPNKKKCKIW